MPENFNPNAASGKDAGIFGLPFGPEESKIILIPVQWELTTSYGKGTFHGPDAILEASKQIDLYNHDYPETWKQGIWMDNFPEELRQLHKDLEPDAAAIITAIEDGSMDEKPEDFLAAYDRIEKGAEKLNLWLAERIRFWRKQGKFVGLIGGDHSIPLAYHQLLAEKGEEYGILQIDAHADLRNAYEGFKYSHASIFYNVLQYRNVKKIVQLGIRDYCQEEVDLIDSDERVSVFFEREVRRQMYDGKSWLQVVEGVLCSLPKKVYISIDIDGLDPVLCPHTGTPVPGGLQFEELMYLLNKLNASGREIIGFDLCEVSPNPINTDDEWDGNVGARLLFQLCGILA